MTTRPPKKILFVRHGQATHNAAKTFTDDDTALTDKGREQALATARELAKLKTPITAVISSSMLRTHDTAKIIADELDIPHKQIELDHRLREIVSGAFAGQPNNVENHTRRDAHFLTEHNPMKVEWIGDFAARLESFAADIVKRPEDTVLVVGHSVVGRMLQRIFGGHERTKPMGKLRNAEVMQLVPYVELDDDREQQL